jgi:hypothetical protein
MGELVTVGDAARSLGLSTGVLLKLTRLGRLPAPRAQSGYRSFCRTGVERWVAERPRSRAADAAGERNEWRIDR